MGRVIKLMTTFGLASTLSVFAAAAEDPKSQIGKQDSTRESSEVGMRIDCLDNLNRDKGANKACFNISGLRYSHRNILSDKLRTELRFDPFASPVEAYAETPLRETIPLIRDTDLLLVDKYAVIWSPRPNLEVAFEDYQGSAGIPSTSGLPLAAAFDESGWDQSAITLTYNLSAFSGMKVKFAAGNGEGENGKNLDPQQFFGFEIDAAVIEGVRVNIGVSLDGNSVGSDAYNWEMARYVEDCATTEITPPDRGYSTQRLAFGATLDGRLPAARGLKAGIGWQRNVLSDLDKESEAYPPASELSDLDKCKRLDLDTLFVEDPGQETVNTVQRTVLGLNLSYRILDSYFVGFDYENRRVDTGSVEIFRKCDGFSGSSCKNLGEKSNRLSQSAYTIGGGKVLAEGLQLVLEYNTRSYDDNYSQVFYFGRDGKATDTLEIFNIRVAYNWE